MDEYGNFIDDSSGDGSGDGAMAASSIINSISGSVASILNTQAIANAPTANAALLTGGTAHATPYGYSASGFPTSAISAGSSMLWLVVLVVIGVVFFFGMKK